MANPYGGMTPQQPHKVEVMAVVRQQRFMVNNSLHITVVISVHRLSVNSCLAILRLNACNQPNPSPPPGGTMATSQIYNDPYQILKITNNPQFTSLNQLTSASYGGAVIRPSPLQGGGVDSEITSGPSSTKSYKPSIVKHSASDEHNGHKNKSNARVVVKDGSMMIQDGDQQWYTGCIPVGVDDDKYWLSELQIFLRPGFA